MAEYANFTSLPPNEEAHFVVYEEKSSKNSTSARNISLGIAIPLFLIIVINYLTNRSEEKSIIPEGEDPGISAPAPRPSAPPPPAASPVAPVGAAPAGGAPAAAPAGGAPAAAPAAAPAGGAAPAAAPAAPGTK